MNKPVLFDDERFDDLELDGLGIIQSKSGYGFTSDSVLLANFVKAKRTDKVIELCAGSGVISTIVAYKRKLSHVTLVELQEKQADRAKRSFEFNKLPATVICGKFQGISNTLGQGVFDICFANPPYRSKDLTPSDNIEKALSTHEIEMNLDDLVIESAKLLKFGGKLYVIYPINRLAELFHKLCEKKIEPKEMIVIYPKKNRAAELVLVKAVKGAKPGLVVHDIIQNDEYGNPTEIMKAIYNSK